MNPYHVSFLSSKKTTFGLVKSIQVKFVQSLAIFQHILDISEHFAAEQVLKRLFLFLLFLDIVPIGRRISVSSSTHRAIREGLPVRRILAQEQHSTRLQKNVDGIVRTDLQVSNAQNDVLLDYEHVSLIGNALRRRSFAVHWRSPHSSPSTRSRDRKPLFRSNVHKRHAGKSRIDRPTSRHRTGAPQVSRRLLLHGINPHHYVERRRDFSGRASISTWRSRQILRDGSHRMHE